jgi:hypothetical protein
MPRASGWGGATEARWDLKSGLPSNPAQMLALEGVTFSTVIQIRKASSDRGGISWGETRQDFPAFQVSAALPRGLRLGAGFRADMRSRGSFEQGIVLEELAYRQRFTQEGGLHRFPITLAFPLGSRLRVGLGLGLLRGNLNQEWSWHSFIGPGGFADVSYSERRVRRRAHWHGTSLILGAQAKPRPGYGISLRWESSADLTGSEQIATAGEFDEESVELSGYMPGRWGAGVVMPLPMGGILSAQWDHENWENYESPLAPASLRDVDRFGVGLEWSMGRKMGQWREERRIPLRLGLRVGDYPAADPLDGSEVSERLLGFGTGIEIQEGRGALDLTFFLQRLRGGGAELEKRWGFAFSLRTSEIWQRRKQPF